MLHRTPSTLPACSSQGPEPGVEYSCPAYMFPESICTCMQTWKATLKFLYVTQQILINSNNMLEFAILFVVSLEQAFQESKTGQQQKKYLLKIDECF